MRARVCSFQGCAGLWEHQESSLGGPCRGAAGGVVSSALLSPVISIHPLASLLLCFPPSSGTLICRAMGWLLSKATLVLALG